MASNFLWLDDVRPTPSEKGWDHVRDYNEFVAYIETHDIPDLASLDHDLTDAHYARCYAEMHPELSVDELENVLAGFSTPGQSLEDPGDDGHDCVLAMIEADWLPATVVVHSMNPFGRKNMVGTLLDAGYHSVGYTAVLNAFSQSPVLRRFDAED